ncbi:MAG: hypothetical protein VKN13_06815, partial [Cyanobacteriota bacterium]|nr:hypothetical protein [Cyanobacteriota bacterium]
MRQKEFFVQAQLRLQAAACRYRIKRAPRSPFIQVYETLPPRRQLAARGYRADDEAACWELVELLLRAGDSAARGRAGLAWDELNSRSPDGAQAVASLSWGELRAMVTAWIAP